MLKKDFKWNAVLKHLHIQQFTFSNIVFFMGVEYTKDICSIPKWKIFPS